MSRKDYSCSRYFGTGFECGTVLIGILFAESILSIKRECGIYEK